MKKKKRLADLMEEDLMETTQKRIDELNAELKMLDEHCGKFFTPYPITASRLRCKQDLIELEYEQRRLRREQERLANEARENLLQRAKSRDDFLRRWLGGKWNTLDGRLVFVDTELDSGFYGQNDKTPFLCSIKSCLLYTSDAADDA